MNNIFVFAGIISIIFFIAKFLETKYLDEEPKPLKFIIRDTLIVYMGVIGGSFVLDQLKPVMDGVEGGNPVIPLAFTDNPPF
jgi:hypothetical protein